MKTSYQKRIKLTTFIFTILILVLGVSLSARAHMGGSLSEADQFMEQMMGSGTFARMEQIEEQMMGEENHERMQELMDKLFANTLMPTEQEEMVNIMQDSKMGHGAQSMMMRSMMPRALNAYDQTNHLNAFGMMGSGAMVGFGLFWWGTVILVWAFLILGIGVFWKKHSKDAK